MEIDFSLILVIAASVMLAIVLLDKLVLSSMREPAMPGEEQEQLPWFVDWSQSLLPVIILVLIIRSFIFEPFRIPSGSLEPTLQIGDLIVVNKFDYGLRLPVLNTKLFSVGEPKRGDIAVFRWPVNPHKDYIKRIVGLPGDHVVYKDKTLFINGVEAKQKHIDYTTMLDEQGNVHKVEQLEETINGISHRIFVMPDVPAKSYDYTVPRGSYFAMGDNRDDSSDSRYWGFVPEGNLLGKAIMIWMSWNNQTSSVRTERIGKRIV